MRQIRKLESYIHDKTLQDLLAAHLIACSIVNGDEEVLELTIGDPDRDGVRPLRYSLIKLKEVDVIVHS